MNRGLNFFISFVLILSLTFILSISLIFAENESINSTLCGNNISNAGETCDDGNNVDGDGCSSICLEEEGWECVRHFCYLACGDGQRITSEECDDGNNVDGDGCSSTCIKEPIQNPPYCGDGKLDSSEDCDLGGLNRGETCEGLGYKYGSLLCINCKYDSSSCSNYSLDKCTDSDGGTDFYVKGNLTYPREYNIYYDICYTNLSCQGGVCVFDGPHESGDPYLREFYCTNSNYSSVDYECPNGCKEGRCISDNQVNKNSSGVGKNLTLQGNKNEEVAQTKNFTNLSNGRKAEIKIMPETASQRALEVLEAKCEETGCKIELKEVGKGNETRAAYEVQAKKQVKIFGLFKAQMNTQAEIDAETGEVVKTKHAWWGFLAKK